MSTLGEIFYAFILISLVVFSFLCGYCYGRASGIRWTRKMFKNYESGVKESFIKFFNTSDKSYKQN